MKKIILTAMVLFAVNVANAQTTWDDYRYVVKGYQSDKSIGRPMPDGFSFIKIGPQSSVNQSGIVRYAQLYYFKKTGITKAFAIQCWDSKGNSSFFCIPTSDAPADIWDESLKAMYSGGQEWQLVFSWALAKVISEKL